MKEIVGPILFAYIPDFNYIKYIYRKDSIIKNNNNIILKAFVKLSGLCIDLFPVI